MFDVLLCVGCPNTGGRGLGLHPSKRLTVLLGLSAPNWGISEPSSCLVKPFELHAWPAQAPRPPFVSYVQSNGVRHRPCLEGQDVPFSRCCACPALRSQRAPATVPTVGAVRGLCWAGFLTGPCRPDRYGQTVPFWKQQ